VELLEREPALAQLHAWLDDAVARQGRVALVAGEAGIGKSALVQQFCRSLAERADVLAGACDPLSTPTPLGPLLDIAPALGGEFEQLLREAAPIQHVFAALLAQLHSGPRPRVVVIEDMHWADDATLDMLRFLARRLSSTRTLLIVTYREDEVGPRHPLRVALGDVAGVGVLRRLGLDSLSLTAVAKLASGSGLHAGELHRRTGGNPFFVSQVLAAPTVGVPMNVRDAVLARIARLSPAARSTLEAAAVIGPRIDLWLVERVGTGTPDGLDECVEAGLLLASGAHVEFRHELVREAVLETLRGRRHTALHWLVMAALVEARIRDDLLARLAHHAEGAGDRDAVLRFAPAAARRAAQLGAHREAAAQFDRALRWADDLDLRERARLLEGRGLECHLTDQPTEAIAARQQAIDIWHQLGEREREGDNLHWLARSCWLAGRNAEAAAANEQALRVLESVPPGATLAWALTDYSQTLVLRADYDAAIPPAERAVELARGLDAPDLLARATFNVGAAHLGGGDVSRGLAEAEAALHMALDIGFHEEAARAMANIGSMHVVLYELDRGQAFIGQGIAYAREHDLASQEHYLVSWRAVIHLLRGQWAAALDLAQGLEATGGADVNRINALTVIGLVRARRGEPRAWEPLDTVLELAERTGELQRVGPVRAARAEAAWLAGDLARAAEEARPAFELFRQKYESGRNVAHWYVAETVLWLWRAGALPRPVPSLPQQFEREIAGDWAGAAALWRQIGCPYDEARALSDSTDVASLRQALRIAEELGALPLAARVVDRLRQLGARPASPRPRADRSAQGKDPSGLSARELQVVGLIAEGCTNREIAECLVITERTAESHVQRILNRLGLRSRIQVAAWAIQKGIGAVARKPS
jgi:DNA-binding CsgD family transcriptional regulator/tetratricopeptide (TPR) repeat protein